MNISTRRKLVSRRAVTDIFYVHEYFTLAAAVDLAQHPPNFHRSRITSFVQGNKCSNA